MRAWEPEWTRQAPAPMQALALLGHLVLAVPSLLPAPTTSPVEPQGPPGLACDPAWLPAVGELGTDAQVRALAMFDDGSGGGPALYAAGTFSVAGDVSASRIAKFDGVSWSPLGEGIQGDVNALAVYNDGLGGGPALYAGGAFSTAGGVSASNLAKWNGSAWSAVGGGANQEVLVLKTMFDLGAPALQSLLVGGRFTSVGGVPANRIAKRSGNTWSALGAGVGLGSPDRVAAIEVEVVTVTNVLVYVGGRFTQAGGVAANNVARWNGSSWSALGAGLASDEGVSALLRHDDGNGFRIYAGGRFTLGVQGNIARWNGSAWSVVGNGVTGCWRTVHSLVQFNDELGGGLVLYAGGMFEVAGGMFASKIARWNGISWAPLGAGITGNCTGDGVYALAPTHLLGTDPTPRLFVGGIFSIAGGHVVRNVAQWSGGTWDAERGGPNQEANAIAVGGGSGGGGSSLYLGGQFTRVAGVAANRIAKLENGNWSALGSGLNGAVYALAVLEEAGGGAPSVIAGGTFTQAGGIPASNVARWNGSSWSPMASGLNGAVGALAVFDDGSGPAVYAGGYFSHSGALPVNQIAKWNGTSWQSLGSGVDSIVTSLAVYDDGSGSALYVGGYFNSAGGVPAYTLAKWSGTAWSSLGGGANYFGNGTNSAVYTLAVHDDGSGSALYAGGPFTAIGDSTALFLAKWNGSTWAPLGTGPNDSVMALGVYDEGTGSGPALFAAGSFWQAGGAPAMGIAKWNGAAWSPLGDGLNATARALASYDDGTGLGASLYVAGPFTATPTGPGNHLARWGGCAYTPAVGGVVGPGFLPLDDCGTLEVSYTVESNGTLGPGSWSFEYGPGFPTYDGWEILLSPLTAHSAALAFHASGSSITGDYPITVTWKGLFNGAPVVWSQSVTCRLLIPCPTMTLYCFGDGSGTPCPCANPGGTGAGCANSTGLGARLSPWASPSIGIGGFGLVVNRGVPHQPGLFFQGTNQTNAGNGAVFGDGLRCAGAGVVRLQVRIADANGYSHTTTNIPSAGSVAPGDTRFYQVWYRDPSLSPCGSGLNWTNGLGVTWLP